MRNKDLYFVHQQGSPLLAPVAGYLQQLGIRKSTGILPHSLDMHYNDGIEICYVLKGIYKWRIEDRYYEVYPGEVFVTCPWQWHGSPDETLDRGVLSWTVIIPERFTSDGSLELGSWSTIRKDNQAQMGALLAGNSSPVIVNGGNLAEIFRKIYNELAEQGLCYLERVNLLTDSLLISLSRSLMKRGDQVGRNDTFAVRLQEKMRESFTTKITIDNLAFSFGMSATTFNNRVKTLTGFSPAEYQLGLRIGLSKELLAHTDKKIIDIAMECGFYSSQHFATQFANFVGMSPSKFRKEIKSR